MLLWNLPHFVYLFIHVIDVQNLLMIGIQCSSRDETVSKRLGLEMTILSLNLFDSSRLETLKQLWSRLVSKWKEQKALSRPVFNRLERFIMWSTLGISIKTKLKTLFIILKYYVNCVLVFNKNVEKSFRSPSWSSYPF